jgi:hypothetical protein
MLYGRSGLTTDIKSDINGWKGLIQKIVPFSMMAERTASLKHPVRQQN